MRLVGLQVELSAFIRGGLIPILARRIYKEFREMDSASALSIEALTLEMLAQATRRGSSDLPSSIPGWLREARDLLHEQFAQPVGLSSVAESVGVHPAHLEPIPKSRIDFSLSSRWPLLSGDRLKPILPLAPNFGIGT